MSASDRNFGAAGSPSRWAGAILVSAPLLGGVVWFGDPAAVWAAARDAETGVLAVAFGLYLLATVCRCVRLRTLVGRECGWIALLGVSAGHSFASQIGPARTGELAFPALWARTTSGGTAEGSVYLVAIRIIELAVVVPLYGLALALWWSDALSATGSAGTAAAFVAVGLGTVAALPSLLRVSLSGLSWILSREAFSEIAWLESVRRRLPRAREAVDRLSGPQRAWLVATTVAMWGAMFCFYWAVLVACAARVGAVQAVLGAGGGILGNLVPVGAIGSLGAMEAGWTAAFEATGAAAGPVVAAGLIVRAMTLAGAGLATTAAVVAAPARTFER